MVEMLPGFAAAVFRGGPETLALLTSTFGAGAIAGGLWLAGRGDSGKLRGVVLVAALCVAVGLALFAATDNLWVAVPATALIGLALVITGAGSQTLIQLHVAQEMRGRVLSLYGLILRGGPAFGALVIGWVAEFVGLRWPIAGGALLVALAAIVVWRRPA
jgi:predicted MFS family arabinose efflux permease